jgi:hypothetical protein
MPLSERSVLSPSNPEASTIDAIGAYYTPGFHLLPEPAQQEDGCQISPIMSGKPAGSCATPYHTNSQSYGFTDLLVSSGRRAFDCKVDTTNFVQSLAC